MSKPSGAWGPKIKGLIFLSSEPHRKIENTKKLLEEIVAENVPSLVKKSRFKKLSKKDKFKTHIPKHIKIKLLKTKDKLKILKAARKRETRKQTTILMTYFSPEVTQARSSSTFFKCCKNYTSGGGCIIQSLLCPLSLAACLST